MRKQITLLLTFFTTLLFGQANLVLTANSFQPSSLARGEMITIQATVSNIGNVTAAPNFMFIYFTPDLTIIDDEIISRVSIKELAPNESQEVSFTYPVPHPIIAGSYYIGFEIDRFNVVPESDEDNLYCSSDGTGCVTFNVTNASVNSLKFNYPVIFVHGLASNSKTWDTFINEASLYYGWSPGGRLDYCLNPDGDVATSDQTVNSFVNISNLGIGDYYLVNFDVSTNGSIYASENGGLFNVLSNQSAITKQGWAMQHAIEKVLDASGSDKVILVGHSMGGLASREYLQNPSNWQSDGQHHVAKLLTIASPHGGSNVTTIGLLDWIAGIDVDAEAVRDLRYYSPILFFDGRYLDGGIEDGFPEYYNNDVDCNGIVGNNIIGLNYKSIPLDVNYSCIFSTNDEVVDSERANLNNYPIIQPPFQNIQADTFIAEINNPSPLHTTHQNIHKENHGVLIQGIDEPTFYDLAYPIPLNSFKFGHSTVQSGSNPAIPSNNAIDWDDYSIDVPVNGLLEVNVTNIPVNSFALFLLDNNFNILVEVQSLGESNIGFSYAATPGTYYVELGSIPTANSLRYPYAYSVQFTPEQQVAANFTSNIQEGCTPLSINFSNTSTGNPTSFNWTFQGGNPATSTAENPTVTYSQPGTYPVSLVATNSSGSNTSSQNNYITVNQAPVSAFDFVAQQNNTVVFTNQTQFVNTAPNYLWNFGDGQTSTETSPSHTYSTGGTYTVTLTATNGCGNSTTNATIDITVLSADFVSNTQAGCSPTNINFSDMSAGTPTNYSWTFEGGNPSTSTDADPVVSYNTPGVYSVVLVVSNTNENSTITKTDFITIDQVPVANFSFTPPQNNTVTFINETQYSNTPTFSWDFGDTETSNLESPSHTYAIDGSYPVQLTASNDCGNSNSTKTVDIVSVSTNEALILSEVTIFPNPNQGQFTLRISGDYFGEYETIILNNLGQVISKGIVNKSGDTVEYQFNLSSLASGTYWVSLASEREKQVRRVVKF